MKPILIVLLAGCTVGCNRVGQTFPVVTSNSTTEPGSESHPSKAEVLEYLDGKMMPLALSGPAAKSDSTVMLQKDQIEALEVQPSGTSVNNGPWKTPITFVATTSEGKYAVHADVMHRRVENKRAFFGLEFKEIAKQ